MGEAVEQSSRDGRRQQRLAARNHPDGVDELRGLHVLEQEAARTRAQRFIDVLVRVKRGEDHDPRARPRAREPARRLPPAQGRHPNGSEDDGGAAARGELQRVGAVLGLADHLHVRARLQHHPKAAAYQRLVVADQHPHRHRDAPSSGIDARTAKPPWERGPACSSPPNTAARSRIPIRPCPRRVLASASAVAVPSSTICTSSISSPKRRSTRAVAACPCLSVFVSASCTMRYAEKSIPAGSAWASPETVRETSSP